MASQYFFGRFKHQVANSALTDITAPTFAGITSLVANANGSLSASWAAATDTTNPIRYEIYIKAFSPSGLFSAGNIQNMTYDLGHTLFTDANDVPLQEGVTYFVGVRALDAVGNMNTNTTSLSAISTGVPSNSIFNIVSAIKAQTDKFSFDGSNFVNAHTKVNDDKTDYALASADKAALVGLIWNELQAGYVAAGSFGSLLNATITSRGAQSDINTLLTRLNSTRAGNLDNLDATITSRASQSSVNNIQNNTLFVGVVPPVLVLPASGSKTYRIYSRLYNEIGSPVNSDGDMTVTIKNPAGSTLSTGAMTNDGVGSWHYDYVVQSTDTEQPLTVTFTYLQNSVAFDQVRTTEVQEFESKLDTLLARLSASRASNLDYLDAAITSRGSQADIDTLLARLTSVRADALDLLDVAISTRADQGSVDTVISQTVAQAIADAVWNELLSAHQVAGTAGLYLSQSTSSGIAEAVWGLVRSGNMASGTFGEIMDALISSRASQASLNNLQTSVDGLQSNPNQFVGTVEEDGVIAGTADTGT